MSKPELKTQADVWKYLLGGSTLMLKCNKEILGLKDDNLWSHTTQSRSIYNLSFVDDFEPYIEPMKDEFECCFTYGPDKDMDKILDKYIGKRVKIVIAEIV